MPFVILVTLICSFLAVGGCARPNRELLFYAAPSELPAVRREMKTPGFWIGRLANPDQVWLNDLGVKEFNHRTEKDLGQIRDLSNVGRPYAGDDLSRQLRDDWQKWRQTKLYNRLGNVPDNNFGENLKTQMAWEDVPSQVQWRYGIVARYAHQRVLPTDEVLTKQKLDLDFDELQNSSLDVGVPVIVLHTSQDGEWVYVLGRLSDGWVKTTDIAFCGQDEFEEFYRPMRFVVTVSAKTDIYLDSQRTRYYDYARMGTRFPIAIESVDDSVQVLIPGRNPQGEYERRVAYLTKEDVSVGYLPLTSRQVLEQAFKLLNAPYGWGGMYGEQDCSAFLVEIFNAFGLELPRNSSQQAKVGKILIDFAKQNLSSQERRAWLAQQAVGGMTILPLKGHIMLYLGEVGGTPYAIHATWAYREPRGNQDRVRLLNRVVVSSLDLGQGSLKGSLLERLTSLNQISDSSLKVKD